MLLYGFDEERAQRRCFRLLICGCTAGFDDRGPMSWHEFDTAVEEGALADVSRMTEQSARRIYAALVE